MAQRTQCYFISRKTGGPKIVVILLSFYIWTQMSCVSYAQTFDLILTKRLKNNVCYDEAFDVPSKCHCRITCFARPECTAATYTDNVNGRIGCRYSNKTQLSENNFYHAINAVTFLMPGVMDSALVEKLQELTYNYYIASNNTGCEKPFVQVEGTSDCIFLAKETKRWKEAKKLCEDINSQLYVASSSAAFDALRGHILGIDAPNDIWVAIEERKWTDGRPVDTNEWKSGSPNGDLSQCARMSSSADFKVDDKGCDSSFPFLCQRGGIQIDDLEEEIDG